MVVLKASSGDERVKWSRLHAPFTRQLVTASMRLSTTATAALASSKAKAGVILELVSLRLQPNRKSLSIATRLESHTQE
jgi:hypothetical protein